MCRPSSSSSRPTIHDRVFLAEDVGEAALRQTAVQRHLAAFKSAHLASSRIPTFAPLCAATGVFAAAASPCPGRCAAFCASGLWPAASLRFISIHRSDPYPVLNSYPGWLIPSTIRQQVRNLGHHPAERRRVRPLDDLVHLLQPEARTISLCFSGVQIGLCTSLILIVPSAISYPALLSFSTTDAAHFAALRSGRRSCSSALIVAFTTLCGLRDADRLRQHVRDADRLNDGAHRTAGDHTRYRPEPASAAPARNRNGPAPGA